VEHREVVLKVDALVVTPIFLLSDLEESPVVIAARGDHPIKFGGGPNGT
jgi:hypothetical protein